MSDLEFAKDKVLMGVERKSMIVSEQEKKITAYHEAGHALVAKLTPGTDPVYKVSIIPRGMALGTTQQLPIEDKYMLSRDYLHKAIRVLLGGRAAEEIVFKERTTGAGNDLERATEMARKMVTEWGMSDKVGPVSLAQKEGAIFLGKEISSRKEYSEATTSEVDSEIKEIVFNAYDKAVDLLKENEKILHALATLLLDKEVVDAKDLDNLLKKGSQKESNGSSSEWPGFKPEPTTAFGKIDK